MAGPVEIRLEPPLSFIQAQSGAFRAALLDLQSLWSKFEDVMSAIGVERFESEGYGNWAPLADSTVRQKAAHSWPMNILERTGDLKASLSDPGRAAQTTPQSMTWGTDVPYAGYHQEGTPKMPARPVLEIRVEDRRRLEVAQVTWINEVARMTWGRI